MKNTLNVLSVRVFGIIAFITVFTLSAATCIIQSGGGKSLNSAEALKEYLDKQPANSPDKPIKVSMGANAPMLEKINYVLNDAGKYVSLNLTGNVLTEIPSYVFRDCETLVSITIPNSVTSIGKVAFEDCRNLASINIPDSVTSIEEKAFLKTAWLDNQPDGIIYAGKVALGYKGKMPANITFLDGTKGIGDWAFANRTDSYSDSVTRITSVIIPDSVTSIGFVAFSGCTRLTSVTIGNSVTSIGAGAFNYTGLTSVTIPDSVTSIGDYAFLNCKNLTRVTFQGKIDKDNLGNWELNRVYPVYRPFPDDLEEEYIAGGIGTYTRDSYGTWTKQ